MFGPMRCRCKHERDDHAYFDVSAPDAYTVLSGYVYAQVLRNGVRYAIVQCQVSPCICRRYQTPRGLLG